MPRLADLRVPTGWTWVVAALLWLYKWRQDENTKVFVRETERVGGQAAELVTAMRQRSEAQAKDAETMLALTQEVKDMTATIRNLTWFVAVVTLAAVGLTLALAKDWI